MKIRKLLPWLLIALAGLGAAWLRYGLIEQPAFAELCTAAQAPAWCALRQGLVVGFLHDVYGIAAVVLAALALLRRSSGWACLAAMLGAFALQLYNYEPGALALLVGCLRLVHLQGASNRQATAIPAR
ncbi:hypothetical protein IHE49_05090 [Rhodanobacter sp. 7MK24]|uniref:hypothetical protein n=1 Tax=Rhodanobacter sp. 7MK24 TaxID=2775922 RepID=UPI00177C10C1|nr:hypothetical protein [Rhodanobacter sp. 7MK24]MBD8879848.1 hypothetical protein [Rhodanobacter sp. 7MK24]